jgi:hypothetical protein
MADEEIAQLVEGHDPHPNTAGGSTTTGAMTPLQSFSWWIRVEDQPGVSDEGIEEGGTVLHALEPGGVELGSIGGQVEDRQPGA